MKMGDAHSIRLVLLQDFKDSLRLTALVTLSHICMYVLWPGSCFLSQIFVISNSAASSAVSWFRVIHT